jgi:hypothetical protein
MKNSIRFLCASLLLTAISTGAFAQNSASNSAAVTATLLSNLALTKIADIAFAYVSAETMPFMSASSSIRTSVGSGATLGKFTVTGTAGASVRIHYDTEVTLTNSMGALNGQLTFLPSVARTENIPNTNGVTDILNDASYTINTLDGPISTSGTDFIFVGGTLGVKSAGTLVSIPALGSAVGNGALNTGSYSGTFHISATYN